jgi:hypothetical protein
MTFVLAALLLSAPLSALQATAPTDVSGAWAGILQIKMNGETHQESVRAALKQTGTTLEGTAGPDADRQFRIRNGKVIVAEDTTAVSFDLILDGVHTSFDLKLAKGALKGSALVEGEDGQRHEGTVELTRVAPGR